MSDTKKFKAACICLASYTGTIDVPADYTLSQAIEYAWEHIAEIPIESGLEYISNSDEVDGENCEFQEILEGGEEWVWKLNH